MRTDTIVDLVARSMVGLIGVIGVSSCTHQQTMQRGFAYEDLYGDCMITSSIAHHPLPKVIVYDDVSTIAEYATQLAPTAQFDRLPGKKWGELSLWTIEYNHYMPGYQPEYVEVSFIERTSITTNVDGFIEFNILRVKLNREGRQQFMAVRQVAMLPNDESEEIKKDLNTLEHFRSPDFYADKAARSILALSSNASIRTSSDLILDRVEYDYFKRPQIAEVQFQVVGTLERSGKHGYTWKTKSVNLLPSGQVLETQ